jgi:hypothetical protein
MVVVVGYSKYSFNDKTSGKLVEGYTIYFANSIQPEKGKGYSINEKLYKASVSNEKLELVLGGKDLNDFVGKFVDPLYNSYHRLEQLRLLDIKK